MPLDGRAGSASSLTHLEAAARSAEVSGVHYAVDLDLTVGERLFATTTVVRFEAASGAVPVFLDFAGTAESVECNGRELGPDAQ